MNNCKDLHEVFLALGTNLGDKETNLKNAVENINNKIGEVISLSSFYATKPEGFESDNSFLNAACSLQTPLTPELLLEQTQLIEKDMGRQSKSHNNVYTDRIIDIDILLFDNLQIETENLILPHPHMHKRLFVMQPLAEIAPNYVHPIIGKTFSKIELKLHI